MPEALSSAPSAPTYSLGDFLEPTDTLGMYRGILSNEMNCDKVDTLEWSIAITSRLLLRRRNGRNARRPVLEQKLRRLLGRWRAGAGVALGFAAWRRDAARRRVDRLAAAFGRLVALCAATRVLAVARAAALRRAFGAVRECAAAAAAASARRDRLPPPPPLPGAASALRRWRAAATLDAKTLRQTEWLRCVGSLAVSRFEAARKRRALRRVRAAAAAGAALEIAALTHLHGAFWRIRRYWPRRTIMWHQRWITGRALRFASHSAILRLSTGSTSSTGLSLRSSRNLPFPALRNIRG